MPPRRSHKKSRTGCLQCKKRRVKCDERGPPCGNCITRQIECAYSSTPAVARPPDTSSTSSRSPQVSMSPSETPQPATLAARYDLRSLELMHKFSTETYHSLSSDSLDHHAWRTSVPRKALEHDFLLDGILSIASLHIAATKGPSEARSYMDTALEYQNRALTPFRHALNNISPANCDAIYAYSLITIASRVALPQLSTGDGEALSMIDNILHVFELLQGTNEISKITHAWSAQTSFATMTEYWAPAAKSLDIESEDAFRHLAAINHHNNSTLPETHRITEEAIDLLRRCFCRYTTTHDPGSVILWLAVADRRFVDTLRGREPLSLLILGHWGVLLGQLDGKIWWASNSGRALVADILGSGAAYPDAWVWPKRQLGLLL
ncbi:hypothetical protein BDV26DRAFT_257502 [Aspergillus bertholletiae]|uniref:Zn(2)-C6 fungal-type domain-containing protein n=1 Tax=Aspergillus bertholletiae TaxID=1226010 RepID=A0A5N7BEY8_9EURO|nr:hypothetical protein BDV26DRAFT_257502 [Aspergillus bertholletiae]